MKFKKYIIQSIVGLALALFVILGRGLSENSSMSDILLAVCDGFSVTAMLFMAIGGLLWVATTGLFDIFGYAFRKGAHALIPGRVNDGLRGFYEYKMDKMSERKEKSTEWSMLITGCGFLIVSVILTVMWYMVQ